MLITPEELPNCRFYKLTCDEEYHHGIQCKTGLNIDVQSFDPSYGYGKDGH